MKRRLAFPAAVLGLALWSAAAIAAPTMAQVEGAVKAGNYPQAETMMQEVVAAHPKSPKAHYVYAEVLAHEGKFADASGQLQQARTIDPTLKFVDDPAKFRQFESEMQREQAPARVAPAQVSPQAIPQAPVSYRQPGSSGGGIPGWVWFGGIALLVFFVFRAVARRTMGAVQSATYNGGYNQGYGQPGFGQPGYGPGYGAAPGGGLLRTGLAAAGGVAAGMMAEKWLEDRRDDDRYDRGQGQMGGGMGSFDDDGSRAANELENRPIDFGGGTDWGGDTGGGGGSDNFSGGGGSDDGW